MWRNGFWFLAGAFAMLAAMIWSVEYPITIRRKKKPDAFAEPFGDV